KDGIRDFHVTGVQTCALPILLFIIFMKVSYRRPCVRVSLNFPPLTGLTSRLGALECGAPSRGDFPVVFSSSNESTEGYPVRRIVAERAREAPRHSRSGRQAAYRRDGPAFRVRRHPADTDSRQGACAHAAFSLLVRPPERRHSQSRD